MDGLSLDSEEWTLKKIQCIVATTSTNTSVDADGNSVQTSTERCETLTAGDVGGCIALENRWMTQKTLDALYQMRQNFFLIMAARSRRWATWRLSRGHHTGHGPERQCSAISCYGSDAGV